MTKKKMKPRKNPTKITAVLPTSLIIMFKSFCQRKGLKIQAAVESAIRSYLKDVEEQTDVGQKKSRHKDHS